MNDLPSLDTNNWVEAGEERAAKAMHGWIVIDKPVGPGSTQIVSAVKRSLRAGGYAKLKVGHGGTLDPLASGVLPVAIGEATKLCGRMLDADKAYAFTLAFGTQTDTLDLEGVAIATSDVRPTFAQIMAILPRFTGPIAQVPPAFSALKVDGKRAYDLARAGEAVVLASRAVKIRSLQILPGTGRGTAAEGGGGGGSRPDATLAASLLHQPVAGPPPREELDGVALACTVSKGTYIRSLARDIALALGSVGHVAMLRRTRAGPFGLESAISLDRLAELGHGRRLEQALLPLAAGLDDIPALSVTPDQAQALREGRLVIGTAAKPGLHLAIDRTVPVALVACDGGMLKVVRGFNLPMSKEAT